MIVAGDFRKGVTFEYEGNVFVVIDFLHVKPGKGAAIVKAKLKNLRTGAIYEQTFNAGIKVATARIEKQLMQYLYNMNDIYYFMNMESYEQLQLTKDQVGDGVKYLKEDVDTNSIKLIDKGLKLTEGKDLYHNALLKLREGMIDPNHEWANFVKHIIEYVDADIIEKLVPPFMSAFINGYELRKAAQKKYDELTKKIEDIKKKFSKPPSCVGGK